MIGDAMNTQGVGLDDANTELTAGSNQKKKPMKNYKKFVAESKELTYKQALDIYNRSDADKEVDKLAAKTAGVSVDEYINSPNDKKEDEAAAHNLVRLSKHAEDATK
jgi:hypothetical protein